MRASFAISAALAAAAFVAFGPVVRSGGGKAGGDGADGTAEVGVEGRFAPSSLAAVAYETTRAERVVAVVPGAAEGEAVGGAGLPGESGSGRGPEVIAWREGGRGERALEPADLLILALPKSPRPGDDRLFTREAFAAYHARLPEGAWLAILANDQGLLARALLSAGAPFDATEPSAGPPASRVAIVRTGEVGEAGAAGDRAADDVRSGAEPWSYLALLRRGTFDGPSITRLARSVRTNDARLLVGPGVRARPRWASLESGTVFAGARDALRLEFSRRAGTWLDLSPVSERANDFFRVQEQSGPLVRTWTAIGALGMLAVLLLPAGRRRRVDGPDADVHPPIPVLLAPFAALTLGGGLVIVRAVGLSGGGWMESAIAVAAAIGISFLAVRRPIGFPAILAFPIGLGLLAALVAIGAPALVEASASRGNRILVAILTGAAVGEVVAPTLAWTGRRIVRHAPELGAAAGVAFSFGLATAPALAHWVSGRVDPLRVDLAAGAAALVATFAVLWISRFSRP